MGLARENRQLGKAGWVAGSGEWGASCEPHACVPHLRAPLFFAVFGRLGCPWSGMRGIRGRPSNSPPKSNR